MRENESVNLCPLTQGYTYMLHAYIVCIYIYTHMYIYTKVWFCVYTYVDTCLSLCVYFHTCKQRLY